MGLWGKDTEWQADGRLPDIPGAADADRGYRAGCAHPEHRPVACPAAHRRRGPAAGLQQDNGVDPGVHFGALGERKRRSWKVGPVLEVPIPLFDQGQARVGRAVAELRRTQQEYYASGDADSRDGSGGPRIECEGARDRALYYRDILLPLQERIVNEAQLQYNAMQIGPIQLLREREQQIETGVAYVEALREYWLARADAGQISSGRLPIPIGCRAAGQVERERWDQQGHKGRRMRNGE